MVNVVREIRIQASQGIVGQGRQVHDSLESSQIQPLDISNIGAELIGGRDHRSSEIAPAEQARVESYDLVAGRSEGLDHDTTDVAFVARHQDAHAASSSDNRPA